MDNIMKLKSIKILFIIILLSFSGNLLASNDTLIIKKLILERSLIVERIIELLKTKKIDSCLNYFSMNVINKYGNETIHYELEKISNYFDLYSNYYRNSKIIGKTNNNIGAFGHDNNGNYEIESKYTFYDKENNFKFYFKIYYNDIDSIRVITFFDSNTFSPLKTLLSENKINSKKRKR